MKSQEKEAKRIFDLFKLEGNYLHGREDQKKQALICVIEIIKSKEDLYNYENFYKEVEQIIKEKY